MRNTDRNWPAPTSNDEEVVVETIAKPERPAVPFGMLFREHVRVDPKMTQTETGTTATITIPADTDPSDSD